MQKIKFPYITISVLQNVRKIYLQTKLEKFYFEKQRDFTTVLIKECATIFILSGCRRDHKITHYL